MRYFFVVPVLFAILLCYSNAIVYGSDTWVEASFEDFRDGTFDASGQNLFVSAQGRVRTIHRFDLNQDGHLDLVFCSSHDVVHGPKPTLLTLGSDRSEGTVSRLPMAGAVDAAASDKL